MKSMSEQTLAENLLFEKAVKSGDRFRQWYYPHLPENYDINPAIPEMIHDGMARGLSGKEVAEEIYRSNA